MNTSHTPGPWSFVPVVWNGKHEEESPGSILSEDGLYLATVESVLDKGTDFANAKLLASAPDLLACLQDVIGIVESYAYGWQEQQTPEEAQERALKARAAIARATQPTE